MKYCPYCTKRLPFFNIVWASLLIGTTGGYLLGKFMGNFSIQTILISLGFGLILFAISSYFTAPIRDA